MAVRLALFRMFLATILVLNGIASAMATVHHVAGSATTGVVAEAVTAESVAPATAGAHGDCGEPDPVFPGHGLSIAGGTHGPGTSPEAEDCCEPGTCQGTCANTGVPALPSVTHGDLGNPGQAGARRPASWRAAPALPHLMRPPIS